MQLFLHYVQIVVGVGACVAGLLKLLLVLFWSDALKRRDYRRPRLVAWSFVGLGGVAYSIASLVGWYTQWVTQLVAVVMGVFVVAVVTIDIFRNQGDQAPMNVRGGFAFTGCGLMALAYPFFRLSEPGGLGVAVAWVGFALAIASLLLLFVITPLFGNDYESDREEPAGYRHGI